MLGLATGPSTAGKGETKVYLCLVLQPMPGRQPGVQLPVVAKEKQTNAHKKETYSLIVNSAHASA